TATVGAQITIPRALNLAPFAPGIFSMNGQGNGQGIVRDSQGQLVDISNPATAGDVIQIYCTGLGAVDPRVQTGALTPGDTPVSTTTLPTVTIGDAPAPVLFSVLALGEVGLYRVDALVPDGSARRPSLSVAII